MSNKFAGLGLEVETPQRLTLLHPRDRVPMKDSNGVEAYIDLISADSPEAKKHERFVAQRRIDIASQRQGRRAAPVKLQVATMEAENIDLLAMLTKGWHLVTLDGATLTVECNFANARELYEAPALAWLTEQVDAFVFDRANFVKASSNSSSAGPTASSAEPAA